jgi:tRNA (cmo5U34)-methyltransferase
MILSYYCIQFIRPKYRQDLLDKIYQALNWGGAFILFEKVRFPDARFQDIFTTLYGDYKLEQGYSPSEIVGKTRSLKGGLEPFSTQGNIDLLKRAGFQDVVPFMKYLGFEGLLCIK